MTAPRTAAGRALATMLWADDTFSKREADEPILAIEAEAVAESLALLRALVEPQSRGITDHSTCLCLNHEAARVYLDEHP